MGIFSDLLANTINLDVTLPTTALDKQVLREIDQYILQGDVEYPVALVVRDEVQTIVQYTSDPSAGDFTLTFTMRNGETFVTGDIAFDATAGTIETAIDTAANGVITGWTDGDISVSGGTLLAAGADVLLTYDGASVAGLNHAQATIDGAGLTGGGLDSPAENTVTEGQTNRTGWGALIVMGIAVEADVPDQGVAPSAFVSPTTPGSNANYPSQATIRALAEEASISDDNLATKTEILAAAGLPA